MRWITRERPKVDRVACPWLISRFIDTEGEFIFVSPDEVIEKAQKLDATPYDVHGVELIHDGELCSFDAFLKKYKLDEPELGYFALIVRGADTDRHDLTPETSGARSTHRVIRTRFKSAICSCASSWTALGQ